VSKKSQPKKAVVTAEDAERIVADAWPVKRAAVLNELNAAANSIAEKHGVHMAIREIGILPRWLAAAAPPGKPTDTNPPEEGQGQE